MTTALDPERVYTVPEIADHLHQDPQKIRRLARQGVLPCLRAGQDMRFLGAAVLAFQQNTADVAQRQAQWRSAGEVAEYLRVAKSTVLAMIHRGDLAAERTTRGFRVSTAAVDALFSGSAVTQ